MKIVLLVAMACSLLVSIAEGSAHYKCPGPGKEEPTYMLDESGISDTVVYVSGDEDIPGIGDLYIWNNPIDNVEGGRVTGSCVRTQKDGCGEFEWNCTSQYQLPEGKVFLAGGLPVDEGDSVEWGVTGGTGKYTTITGGYSVVYFPAENNIGGLWRHDVFLIEA